jgi:hypothetical protein
MARISMKFLWCDFCEFDQFSRLHQRTKEVASFAVKNVLLLADIV